MPGGISDFLYSQLFVGLPRPSTSFAGKTVLVTGSNVGLGKEAARHFVSLGASTVILAVRSIEKGEAAKKDIQSTTKCSSNVLHVWQLDMSSYQSVLEFGSRVEKELGRLDAAVLNAGVVKGTYETFEEDEATITVNVVCTFLLALLLLPKMKHTASIFNIRPTLSIVSSEVHYWAKFEERNGTSIFESLNTNDRNIWMEERYRVSKLLGVLGVRAMADRRSATQIPVTINCLNPGFCHSELSRESGLFVTVLKMVLARSTEYGSRTLVHAASQGAETHGAFLSDCHIQQPSDFILSKEGFETQNRFWDELCAKLEAIKEGVTNNL